MTTYNVLSNNVMYTIVPCTIGLSDSLFNKDVRIKLHDATKQEAYDFCMHSPYLNYEDFINYILQDTPQEPAPAWKGKEVNPYDSLLDTRKTY